MPKKIAMLTEALKNIVSQNLIPNVAYLAESVTRSRGDILSVAGSENTCMYIIDQGEVGIVNPKDTLASTSRVSNLMAVDFVEYSYPVPLD